MSVVKFPYSRREAARRPRRSKNGTPEEREAKAGAGAFRAVPFKPRRSKNGTPEERAAKQRPAADMIDLEAVLRGRLKVVQDSLRDTVVEAVGHMDSGQRAEVLSLLSDDSPPGAA